MKGILYQQTVKTGVTYDTKSLSEREKQNESIFNCNGALINLDK